MSSTMEPVFTLVVGLLIYVAVWRLYRSPIAHIPGPRLAALTRWYEFYYDVIQPAQYIFKIQELHKRYGPVVRIAPNEIHINDASFLDTVYAPASVQRDKFPYQLRSFRMPNAMGFTADFHTHRKRRESLAPFFSKRNVVHLEPVIQRKVDQLVGIFKQHGETETPLNISDAFFAFSYDVITNFCFARQVDILADLPRAARMRANDIELILGTKVNQHFPLMTDFLEALPAPVAKRAMPPGLADMKELFSRVRAELEEIQHKQSTGESGPDLHTGGKISVFHTLLNSDALPSSEKNLTRLEQEGAVLVLAGTESPAKTLSIILYHLGANPLILSKLQEELAAVPASPKWVELERLPYLSAVIEEGNRLSFGVTARMARIAPTNLIYTPQSDRGRPVVIPAGTPVSITTLSVHTDETIFPDPYTFDPDRWLQASGAARRKYQMAFNRGGQRCLGIELARAELYLVVAALARNFAMELHETNYEDIAFLHDYHISLPKLGSKGVRILPSLRC